VFAVSIHPRVLEQMIQHARRAYPRECCGLLSGFGEAIDGARQTPNQSRSSRQFSVPPEQLFAFFRELRQKGRRHLGIYHSHPRSESLPSARDEEGFHYPEVSYWIISLKEDEPEVGCFKWHRGGFERIAFEVIPGNNQERQGVK
jgi:proteasome lid subunit RPN8/RPN11